MKSLAIIRATDILKLKSTLIEMNKAGLNFEDQPKEINPVPLEKTLSKDFESSSIKYEVCALVPLLQDCESTQLRIKDIPFYSDVHILDTSHELFNSFSRLIPVLPDLAIPKVYYKDVNKKTIESRSSTVYLGVFVNRRVQVQTNSGTTYTGVLKHADSIGAFLEPEDDSSPVFFTWHEIKKIMIPKEQKK